MRAASVAMTTGVFVDVVDIEIVQQNGYLPSSLVQHVPQVTVGVNVGVPVQENATVDFRLLLCKRMNECKVK